MALAMLLGVVEPTVRRVVGEVVPRPRLPPMIANGCRILPVKRSRVRIAPLNKKEGSPVPDPKISSLLSKTIRPEELPAIFTNLFVGV